MLADQQTSTPITVTVVGCGNRGVVYSNYALKFQSQVKVVAAADPNLIRLTNLSDQHSIPLTNRFESWQHLSTLPKLSDAVIIATQDQDHLEPTLVFAKLGYAILLEKPMATNLEQCRLITDVINKYRVPFAVGHVLRYTLINLKLKELLQNKVIGNLVNVQHLEPVGYSHFAHSFVRGNWGNSKRSTFSLMSKACHDLDLINFFVDSKCLRITSFGSLIHFNKDNIPDGVDENVDRCLDCKLKNTCPYSATKIYIDWMNVKRKDFFAKRASDILDIENITQALRTGPYGKCVYKTDNDVCDNQVVNLQFETGVTVSFTMIAFSEKMCQRKINFFGSLGELRSDGKRFIEHFDFRNEKLTTYDMEDPLFSQLDSSHGDADFRLMKAFVDTVNNYKHSNLKSEILCNADQALESHRWVFAAELARKTNSVIDPDQISEELLIQNKIY